MRTPLVLPILIISILAAGCSGSSGDGKARGCSLRSVSPGVGSRTGGETVTLEGAGFQAGMQVVFGITPALSVTVLSSKEATAITPFSAVDIVVDVTVILPGGRSCALTDAFTYDGPCVSGCAGCITSSIEPVEGPLSGGSTVRIRGGGFQAGSFVAFGSTLAPSTVVVSTTEILAITPPSPVEGPQDVSVSNPAGTVVCRIPDGFSYGSGCSVTSASPTDLCGWIADTVAISGDGFDPGVDVAFLRAGSPPISPLEIRFIDAGTLEVKAPDSLAEEPHDVILTLSGGETCFLSPGVNVVRGLAPPCILSGVSPSTGSVGGGETVTISGSDFPSTPRVFFGTNEAVVVTIGLDWIEVTTPPADQAGLVLVNVIDSGCVRLPCTGAYTYQ